MILRDKGVFCVHPKLSLDKFSSVLVCFLLDDGQVRHSERSDVVSNSARESADCTVQSIAVSRVDQYAESYTSGPGLLKSEIVEIALSAGSLYITGK